MNIQDIADFIDIVKNPAKYEVVLKRFQDEQARLNAVIETVGKVAEIDKIKKQIDKDKVDSELSLQAKEQAVEKQLEQRLKVAADAQKKADDLMKEAQTLLMAVKQKEDSAKDILQAADKRDKFSKQTEASITQQRDKLDALIKEYDEKVTKLRAVMA